MMPAPIHSFRLRSFVRRDSRATAAQERAFSELWPQFGLSLQDGMICLQKPCYLEIGFGSGQALLALAKASPEKFFIGIETHKPGIGALLLSLESEQLTNVRVYYADVIDILVHCIPPESLQGVQIFFPDPWPKRRHHPRRLIQTDFIQSITEKLCLDGTLHLATDWEDYAKHMLRVLSQQVALKNEVGVDFSFTERSPFRPILTKFEKRAIREGRAIWDLQFRKVHCESAIADASIAK